MRRSVTLGLMTALAVTLVLTACAGPLTNEFIPGTPGFFVGLLHGFLAPFAMLAELIAHLFPNLDIKLFVGVHIYAEPNSGVWYDVGYVLGASSWSQGMYLVRRSPGKLDR